MTQSRSNIKHSTIDKSNGISEKEYKPYHIVETTMGPRFKLNHETSPSACLENGVMPSNQIQITTTGGKINHISIPIKCWRT